MKLPTVKAEVPVPATRKRVDMIVIDPERMKTDEDYHEEVFGALLDMKANEETEVGVPVGSLRPRSTFRKPTGEYREGHYL